MIVIWALSYSALYFTSNEYVFTHLQYFCKGENNEKNEKWNSSYSYI